MTTINNVMISNSIAINVRETTTRFHLLCSYQLLTILIIISALKYVSAHFYNFILILNDTYQSNPNITKLHYYSGLEIYHSYPTKQDSNKLSDDLQTHCRQWMEKPQHFFVYYSHTNYLQFDHHICSQIFEHIFLQFYCDIYGFAATSNESL
eukprot:162915_1